MANIKPFLRWAGGKSWFINHFGELVRKIDINHYHEPFLGGAAIYFSFEHHRMSYLSDSNEELINAYICIRDNPTTVIQYIRRFENDEDTYYKVRAMRPEDPYQLAARFIYLNQTSYNGIYRVSRSGVYNVPYGKRVNWSLNENKIYSASEKLQRTNIRCGDFECNKYIIKPHDLIFLDPPYTVSHNDNGFIEYNQNLFSLEDQQRLSQFIDYIKRKDAYYILTNAAHQTIATIFEKGDRRLELNRQSLIGGKNSKRQKISEYIFTNIAEVE